MEEKKGRKKFQSQGGDSNPQPSPYKYHEGYILNSVAQYPMHMKERERKCHRAEVEGTEKY